MFKVIPDSVWALLRDELEAKREDVRRLTEALARQNHVTLQLPQGNAQANVPQIEIPPSSGWFDKKPLPNINPPRKETKQ